MPVDSYKYTGIITEKRLYKDEQIKFLENGGGDKGVGYGIIIETYKILEDEDKLYLEVRLNKKLYAYDIWPKSFYALARGVTGGGVDFASFLYSRIVKYGIPPNIVFHQE